MTLLAPPQIGAYAYAAGIKDTRALAAAIAIAMAESGGNTQAHADDADDDSYGLWQINMLGAMGPSRRAQFGLSSNEQLFSPATNARAMAAISSQGTNFRPWTTYQGARYKLFYPAAWVAAKLVIGAGGVVAGAEEVEETVTEPISEAADAINTGLQFIGAARDWLGDRHNWIRIAWWGAGVSMVTIGLLMASRSDTGVKGAVRATKTIAKPVTKTVGAGVDLGTGGTTKVAKVAGKAAKTGIKTAAKAVAR